jgi:hypothetical protein
LGRESEAESVRFLGRRVTKVGSEVKHGLFRRPRNPKKLPLEGFGPLNKRCERRTRALPEVQVAENATARGPDFRAGRILVTISPNFPNAVTGTTSRCSS